MRAEDEPAVGHGVAPAHRLGARRPAEVGAQVAEPGLVEGLAPRPGPGGGPPSAERDEQPLGPVGATGHGAADRAHVVGESGQLGVDEARGRAVPPRVGLVPGGCRAAAREVGEPPREVVHAVVHEGEPLLEALRRGCRVGGPRRAGGVPRGLRLGPGRALCCPLLGEPGHLGRLGDRPRPVDPEDQEREPVLARELAARARAPERRRREVDAHLVGRLARPLALAPEQRLGGAGVGPRPRAREPPGSGQRRGVGSQTGHLLGSPSRHDSHIMTDTSHTRGRTAVCRVGACRVARAVRRRRPRYGCGRRHPRGRAAPGAP